MANKVFSYIKIGVIYTISLAVLLYVVTESATDSPLTGSTVGHIGPKSLLGNPISLLLLLAFIVGIFVLHHRTKKAISKS